MHIAFMEAAYTKAIGTLFTEGYARRKSGEFFVGSEAVWFIRKSSNEVTIKHRLLPLEGCDVIRED